MSYAVLIVDDSATMRGAVKRAIEMSGLAIGPVLEAGNGAEALDLLRENWVDIVFTDLHMPVMSGMDMLAEMADNDVLEKTPIVVVTSDRSETREHELKGLGVRAYITKPFRPERFREVIEEILGPTGGGSGEQADF